MNVVVPMLSSLLVSNDIQVQRVVDRLIAHHGKTHGVVGLAFKANTDDPARKPDSRSCRAHARQGFRLPVSTMWTSRSRTSSAGTRAYIEQEIPHLDRLLVDDVAELMANADVWWSPRRPRRLSLLWSTVARINL